MSEQYLQQAVRDIEIIRRAIERAESGRRSPGVERSSVLNAQLWLHAAMLVVSLGFLAFEKATYQTSLILASAHDAVLANTGLWNLAQSAVVLILGFYGIVAVTAKASSKSVEEYVVEHFYTLRNFSLASDIAVKFAIVSLAIMSGSPQLVSPLLTLFIADYLLQGRLFVLSLRLAVAGAVTCMMIAMIQFSRADASLDIPLQAFVTVCAISMLTVLWEKIALKTA